MNQGRHKTRENPLAMVRFLLMLVVATRVSRTIPTPRSIPWPPLFLLFFRIRLGEHVWRGMPVCEAMLRTTCRPSRIRLAVLPFQCAVGGSGLGCGSLEQ
jgi:hypothetical protein